MTKHILYFLAFLPILSVLGCQNNQNEIFKNEIYIFVTMMIFLFLTRSRINFILETIGKNLKLHYGNFNMTYYIYLKNFKINIILFLRIILMEKKICG